MTPPHPQVRGLSGWRPIARGGLAMVWEACDASSDRRVAVKVYHCPLHQGDPRHFLQETAAARRLAGHPGVVATYSTGLLPDARPYLVMELCPGGSLTRWLEAERRPDQERVRQVGLRVADTLAAAHGAGLLHRDVKPANILIDSGGKARLADFGLAVESAVDADPRDALWMTPAWAPPEAFRLQPTTGAGDVYSLAATLYALLAGRPPRAMGSADDPLDQLLERARQPVPSVPGVQRPLMEVLLAALDDDPAARPSAASLFGQLATVPLHTSRRPALAGSTPRPAAGLETTRHRAVTTERPAADEDRGLVLGSVRSAPRQAPADAPGASEPDPLRKRRRGVVVLAAALAVVVASAVALLVRPAPSATSGRVPQQPAVGSVTASAEPSRGTDPGAPATTVAAGERSGRPPAADRSIRLAGSTVPTKPFQAAQIQGTYTGGANTLLQVERWEEGRWRAFPVPTKTDQSGAFVAYVELGRRGRYPLRVLDPRAGLRSDPVVLVVED